MISVIIPMYNAEKYIGRCLDSLKNQTYQGFELITIPDMDHRGPGWARNRGLEKSTGDTVFFLDADDYLMPNALEVLHDGYESSKCPIVIGGVFRQTPEGGICKFNSPTGRFPIPFTKKILSQDEIKSLVRKYIQTNDIYGVSHCWGRLYEREYLNEIGITFNEKMRVGEDGVFNIECLTYAPSALIINEPLYAFQMHWESSGIEAIESKSLWGDLMELHRHIIYFFKRNGGTDERILNDIFSFTWNLEAACKAYGKRPHRKMVDFSMRTQKDVLLEILRHCRLPIIIRGADTVGIEIAHILHVSGIEAKAFCDYSPEKMGTLFAIPIKGNWVDKDVLYIISVMSIGNVANTYEKLGAKWIPGGLLLGDIDTAQTNKDHTIDDRKYQIESCRIAHRAFLKKDYVFLRSIDIMITEKCSLKCRDCSNLMQYFKKPKNYPVNDIIRDIDILLEKVDEILEMRILGGDAFMHPEWGKVVEHAVQSDKVHRVMVYTNGVVIPNLTPLMHEKVIVVVTNYGELSTHLGLLTESLEWHRIFHKVVEVTDWIDCSSIKKHNRTDEENDKLFQGCVSNNLTTLVDGRVFRCPYAASAHMLGIKVDGYVGIDRKGISDYLTSDKAMGICDYCTSRVLTNKIKPAIQTKKALNYEA